MGERAVAEIVEEAGEGNAENIGVGDLQLGLASPKVLRPRARKVRHAQRMLEAIMDRARKDPAARSELGDAAEALELGCVDNTNSQRVEVDRSVYHVRHLLPAERKQDDGR